MKENSQRLVRRYVVDHMTFTGTTCSR